VGILEKVLYINLTKEDFYIENVPPNIRREYFGGMGVASYLFTKEISPEIDPLSEENILIFSVGPFCGTAVPFSGRHFIMSKSPLTNIIGESSAGGFWGKEFRWTGYNHLIITGKSKNPVYLYIRNGSVEIRGANFIWGKGNYETQDLIKKDLKNESVKIASIGPAGENLVKFSSIMSEKYRAAGRCGMGAVMGSKNLKAIAVKGTQKPEVADSNALLKVVKDIREKISKSPNAQIHGQYGTTAGMDAMPFIGDVPMKNYTLSKWKGSKKIGGEALKKRGKKHIACYNCPVACTGLVEHNGEWVRGPEYETLAMLGSNLLVDDLEALIEWNYLVGDIGMDTISLGATISMFLEILDRNLLDIDLKELGFKKNENTENFNKYKIWGSKIAISNLITLISKREGIGDDLADGVRNFIGKYNLPKDLETHGKGLEIPAHEPRASNLTALDFATSPRGAYHCYEPMALASNMNLKKDIGLSEKVDRFGDDKSISLVVKSIQDASEAYCACGGCIFGFHWIEVVTPWVKALNAINGESYNLNDWMKTGEKIFNLKRKFNLQCGISKEDDTIGPRFFTSIKKGGTKKNVPPLKKLLKYYYELRRWD
jgi:aldehyde:ferredoxin oxidoreductase